MSVDLWKSTFGDDYTRRNTANVGARLQLWKLLFPKGCRSVLEVGANSGQNLEAISLISDCTMYAVEPNASARSELVERGLVHPGRVTDDSADNIAFPNKVADLVFTSGVLIHIPPDKLAASMREIYRCSKRWIICGEYFAPSEEMIPYRGHDNAMWRRDYGAMYLDLFPDLRCNATMFAWKRMTGLDNLTFWVMEKT
jgi:pseudaminic acid biosynthesis-associated methylase